MTKLADMILARREQLGLDSHPTQTSPIHLIESTSDRPAYTAASLVDTHDHDARVIPVAAIEVSAQARKSFRRIEELAADIRERGQLQPIVVRQIAEHQYVLLSGERRLRAIRDHLQHPTIAARLISTYADEQSWRLNQLAENLQREDYEPLELAREFAELKAQFGYSDSTLADKLHVSRTWVWRQLSLLDAPANIQASIESGTLAATEYLNNKALYLSDLSTDTAQGASAATDDTRAVTPAVPNKKAVSRIANIPLPMKTALDLVEILRQLTHEHQLSPIELGKKPTKSELLAVFGTRVQEIKQQLRALQPQGQQHEP